VENSGFNEKKGKKGKENVLYRGEKGKVAYWKNAAGNKPGNREESEALTIKVQGGETGQQDNGKSSKAGKRNRYLGQGASRGAVKAQVTRRKGGEE